MEKGAQEWDRGGRGKGGVRDEGRDGGKVRDKGGEGDRGDVKFLKKVFT